ncbi:MAG: DNA topoisomerase IV subunit B [Pseudomonadota bacterium]|nr:DNA topoisomerase IV subunit B [Pseudomonadota bacterium]
MADLFSKTNVKEPRYSAKDIEVLEGLEPVRKRPGMFIGGTDDGALHHLAAEILDNSMDEVIAGHANLIELDLAADGMMTVRDNGRGIPVDRHPKFKNKSALEVVLTTLHSGGKFGGAAYKTSGGLHGVGLSVVNALSSELHVEIVRDKTLWTQSYKQGKPQDKLKKIGQVKDRHGTTIKFKPDTQIFGTNKHLRPDKLYKMAKAKAYLFKGVKIRWSYTYSSGESAKNVPDSETLHFPGGLSDFLDVALDGREIITGVPFSGEADLNGGGGRAEWAIAWTETGDASLSSYCNTVATPDGGTHESGLRASLAKGLKAFGDMSGTKRGDIITGDDVIGSATGFLSIFIPDPEFQGQTKEKLSSPTVSRLVETSVKDHFEHFLTGNPKAANTLLEYVLERAEERLQRRKDRAFARKTPTRKIRLPGKLADCATGTAEDTEIFLVEGDSAGGSAKQARNRKTQAVLPLRGKILNVASATEDKMRGNQEITDLVQALGCGYGQTFEPSKLRYERVVIMTDADVDGAHIASLLMTFFFRQMPQMVADGNLFLAMPPLYRISQGGRTVYARDDTHKNELLESVFTDRGKIEISRFKGLGEMPPKQLKETTMNPDTRTLLKITLPDDEDLISGNWTLQRGNVKPGSTAELVESLMGRNPELRLKFIQQNAEKADFIDA